jgi:type I restriction enzyme S subunit
MNAKTATARKQAFTGRTAQLQKLCMEITDCHHSTPNWIESGYVVVRSENVKRGKISLQGSSYTDQATFQERISRSVPEPGDLIVTREAPMGEVGIIPAGVQCCLGQRLVLVKPDASKIDRHYLLYAMQSPFVQKQIGASDETGSTVSNLRIPALKELAIPLLDNADEIGAVLAAIDAKIDLNNRINAELEVLAKTIYDYWFVQFDFPDAKGRPYKSSGGAMAWSDTLKREIPVGWELRHLAELVLVSTSAINPAKNPEKVFRHLSIPSFDECGSFVLEPGSSIGSNKFNVQPRDLLVSKLNPWSSRVVADTDHADLICSTEFVVWRCGNAARQAYLNAIATHPRFVMHCTQSASGTSNSHRRVNPQVMMRYQLPYSSSTAQRFGELTAPFLTQRVKSAAENRELTQLRDWLLPLLMNGQVRVA